MRSSAPLLLLVALLSPLSAQDSADTASTPPVFTRDAAGNVTIRATRITEPLHVDGRIEEPVYERVPAIKELIQQDPDEGAAATEETDVWVFFDDRNLYVSARCWDSNPDKIVANEMRRDSFNIFLNDNFTVVLDTFHDKRNGFMFYTNPVGGLSDSYITDERDNNRDWNTVWEARTHRFGRGWSVEMEIPFKSLRYLPGNPQVWGINFRRVIRSKNEFNYLTRIPRSYGGRGALKVSSAATLVGIEVPPASKNLEFKPYVISSLTTDRAADNPFVNRLKGDIGFDTKYGLTRSLIFDFTYNTDFAQVEDDEQQVNLTRFSLFFPEKREFFLEGQGIFSFGGAGTRGGRGFGGPPSVIPVLFFSRRIGLQEGASVPILAGGRLTGRAGPYTLGLLNIQTQDAQEAGALATSFSVVRVKRDFLRRSSIGLMATNRSRSADGDYNNQAFGVDAALAFRENIGINTYVAGARTPGLNRDSLSYRASFDYSGDRYGLEVDHLTVEENFNPEMGFLRRTDFRRNFAQARYSPRPKSMPAVRRFNWETGLEYITDSRGRLESRQIQLSSGTEFENGDRWNLDFERNYELLTEDFEVADGVLIPPGGYNFQNVRTSYSLGPQRRISGGPSFEHGSFFGGNRTEAGYNGRVELSPRLTLEPRVSVNWVDLPWGRFTARLAGTRLNLAFSPRMLLGALLQYNSSNDSLSSNVRFRWEYRPGSELFVVYNEGRNTQLAGFPKVESRSLAVKLTYLLRY